MGSPRRRIVAQKAIQAPVRINDGVHHMSFDEKRLRTAIQTLDGNKDLVCATSSNADKLRAVLASLAYFLELVLVLDRQGVESAVARGEVTMAIEARVLSCLKRLLDGRHRDDTVNNSNRHWNVWFDWKCPQRTKNNCATQLVHNVLTCFLFYLSRDADTAPLVERSGLHHYLIDLCKDQWEDTTLESIHIPPLDYDQTNEDIGAKDITLGIDAFDWCTRTVYNTFPQDMKRMAVFIVPIGPRTLSHLLVGHKLPNNEADEFDLYGSFPSSPSKKRQLPSIFDFAVDQNMSKKRSNKCPICSPPLNQQGALTMSAWKAATSSLTMQHFTIRAIVALALHLKKASPERKHFIREGAIHRLWEVNKALRSSLTKEQDFSALSPSTNSDDQDDEYGGDPVNSRTNTVEIVRTLMHNEVSQESTVLHAMVVAGLRLFTSNEMDEFNKNTASKPKPSHLRPPSLPLLQEGSDNENDENTDDIDMHSTKRTVLEQKLHTISEQFRHECTYQLQIAHANEFARERKALRRYVRERCVQAEQLRGHLVRGIFILGTGRVHQNSSQSMVEWLRSFPTVEKKDQERREQEEIRLRRIMEMQYQIEERRRRERDERLLMATHDVYVPDVTQKTLQDAKRAEFVRVQEEMKHLELQEDAKTSDRKRQAAIEETKRWKQQAAERKQEVRENELMTKQDTFYVEKILREKRIAEEKAKQSKRERVDPLEEQKQHIETMRLLDVEKKRMEWEGEHMRTEDMVARQQRFVDAEKRKAENQRELKARKEMEQLEKESRLRWIAIDTEMAKQAQLELRQKRADERRERREKEKLEKQAQNAWITCYDDNGNAYYYNQLTGVSEWATTQ